MRDQSAAKVKPVTALSKEVSRSLANWPTTSVTIRSLAVAQAWYPSHSGVFTHVGEFMQISQLSDVALLGGTLRSQTIRKTARNLRIA